MNLIVAVSADSTAEYLLPFSSALAGDVNAV